MNVAFYATRVQAEVMRIREEIEAAYDRFPDATLFWGLVDLVDSSNYRIAHGPRDGYVRGETFFSVVRSSMGPCSDVRVIKELGDGVLLCASTFRPLFESVILMDRAATQLAAVAGTTHYPFALRAALGFGAVKRLTRGLEDYLGSPIDELARIIGVRSTLSNLLLHEECYRPSVEIVREYAAFASVSESIQLPSGISKAMIRPVYYREVVVNRQAVGEFRDHFQPWRAMV